MFVLTIFAFFFPLYLLPSLPSFLSFLFGPWEPLKLALISLCLEKCSHSLGISAAAVSVLKMDFLTHTPYASVTPRRPLPTPLEVERSIAEAAGGEGTFLISLSGMNVAPTEMGIKEMTPSCCLEPFLTLYSHFPLTGHVLIFPQHGIQYSLPYPPLALHRESYQQGDTLQTFPCRVKTLNTVRPLVSNSRPPFITL